MLNKYMTDKTILVNAKLNDLLKPKIEVPIIYEAVKYSIDAGGKRLRPILALMANELFGGDELKLLPFACSIEMIHTYSLIHDDLPCMDNDDYRRGKLSNHKVYGDNFATLAGDALLNLAFETAIDACISQKSTNALIATDIIAKSAGIRGMIGGQCIDIQNENVSVFAEELNNMYALKTGALIMASLEMGAVMAGANETDRGKIKEYGSKIGLAFQIADDILDVLGDSNVLGKKIGSDEKNHKTTYISIYGIEKAKQISQQLIEEAILIVRPYGEKANMLMELANYILNRRK